MKVIDLRSDTVTQPTLEMRDAMAQAPVGDDVYGEDPTVNKLEELAAQIMGKEAAIFVASGSMGNLVALLAHCGRADEVILGDYCHIAQWEQAGIAGLGGIFPRLVPNLADGRLALADIEQAISIANDDHCAATKLICLENSWNGMVLRPEYMRDVRELADEYSLSIHLDGARIFNAAHALATKPNKIASYVDSLQFCLSKGLSAPVGSMVCGTREFIAKVRRARKLVGGGMRQAGILAAAGIVALKKMVDRLGEDHETAALLAGKIADLPGLTVEVDRVETNMVFFNVAIPGLTNEQFCNQLSKAGLLAGVDPRLGIRAVTHYGIDAHDVNDAAEMIKSCLVSQAALA